MTDCIDIAALLDPEASHAQRRFASDAVAARCRGEGFFHITGHGLDLGRLIEAGHALFGLDQSAKSALASDSATVARGYLGVGAESGGEFLEVKEGFSYGHRDAIANGPMQSANLWPSSDQWAAEHRQRLEAFYVDCGRIADALTLAAFDAIGFPQSKATQLSDGGELISLMRLFHYLPYASVSDARPKLGSSPHTDWGLWTIILDDGNSGLEFHDAASGSWTSVEPPAGALTVNAGDFFALLSHGSYHSPIHRVDTPERERLSYVYFHYPNQNAKLADYAEEAPEKSAHNTLLDLGPDAYQLCFADYIARKWAAVRRED
jgi:isopenicillin N synthase-like dioxygenase